MPHRYLALTGVAAACRGCSLGSAMLRKTLAACHWDRLSTYLQASNPHCLPLYADWDDVPSPPTMRGCEDGWRRTATSRTKPHLRIGLGTQWVRGRRGSKLVLMLETQAQRAPWSA